MTAGPSTVAPGGAGGYSTTRAHQTPPPSFGARPVAAFPSADERLMERVEEHCGVVIREATALSSVPPEFLAALVANESGGVATAARFEPAVYRHLAEVAHGARHAYGSVSEAALETEIADLLHPKAATYHECFLDQTFCVSAAPAMARTSDEALRELATSWGYTQIMGYHLIGRGGTVQDLLDPQFHFRLALALLAEFAAHFELNLAAEFREMFCCWNTGRPDGATFNPEYADKGLSRMEIYRRIGAKQK
jgi:hypothetical protein